MKLERAEKIPEPELMSVSGKIEKFFFDSRGKSNQANSKGFVVFSVLSSDEESGRVVRTKVTGNVSGDASNLIKIGNSITVAGTIKKTEYGDQLVLSKIRPFIINKEEQKQKTKEIALKTILKSFYFKGVGESLAQRIIDKTKMVDALNPLEPLMSIEALSVLGSPRVAQSIVESMELRKEEIEAVYGVLSISEQITLRQARHSLEDIGINAREKILENPYLLIKVDGISFFTANDIAISMGLKQGSKEQITAAVMHSLQQASSQGHTFLSFKNLTKKVKSLIGHENISDKVIEDAVKNEKNIVINKTLRENNILYFLRKYYEAERNVAKNVLRILGGDIDESKKLKLEDIALKLQESPCDLGNGHQASEEQVNAVSSALMSKMSIITGGPGVGKTTVSKLLIDGFNKAGLKILCATPTGKASKRMEESIGMMVSTIHKALDFTPDEPMLVQLNGLENTSKLTSFGFNAENPLECDVFVLDEFSMSDIEIASDLLDALPSKTIVVFIGDVDQLLSIGPGAVLHDLIKSKALNVSHLTKPYRNNSGIAVKAHQCRTGDVKGFFSDFKKYEDINFVKVNDENARALSESRGVELSADDVIVNLTAVKFSEMMRKGFDVYDDIQILTPMRKGLTGIYNLNRVIRDIANPRAQDPSNPHVDTQEYTFFEGDKILQTVNDGKTNVMNGETGIIKSITKEEIICVFKSKDKSKEVVMPLRDFKDQVKPAWAMTIHKSQGSEYRGVIMPVSKAHSLMLSRSLLYTGMTRGKAQLEIIGDSDVIKKAIINANAEARHTTLTKMIKSEIILSDKLNQKEESTKKSLQNEEDFIEQASVTGFSFRM